MLFLNANFPSLKAPYFIFDLEIVEWILPACLNIHTLKLDFLYQEMDVRVEMVPFKKLKKLNVQCDDASDLKEVTLLTIRNLKTLLTST
jgi:hypothetical protein